MLPLQSAAPPRWLKPFSRPEDTLRARLIAPLYSTMYSREIRAERSRSQVHEDTLKHLPAAEFTSLSLVDEPYFVVT